MGFLEGALYAKIAVLCLVFALLLHLISFGAPNWAETDTQFATRSEHYGLWRFCENPVGGDMVCSDFIDYTTSDWMKCCQAFMTLAIFTLADWMKCCQAFMTLAMFTLAGTLAVSALYTFVPNFEGEMKILSAGMALGGTTTVFMVITIGTFASRYGEWFPNRDGALDESMAKLGWAFGVGACSLCLTFAATGLLLIEMLFGEEV